MRYRGDSPCSLLNDIAERRLIRLILPERVKWTGDAVMRLVRRGLHANARAPHVPPHGLIPGPSWPDPRRGDLHLL